MKKIFTFVAACLIGASVSQAQVAVEKRINLTFGQINQIEVLVKEYVNRDGMNEAKAREKAEKEVSLGLVSLRVIPGSTLRPDLSTWPTSHAAWLATTTYPGSIEVDRDATIHSYLPADLVRKILLKSNSAADEARIQNVRFKGWNGVAGGGNAWIIMLFSHLKEMEIEDLPTSQKERAVLNWIKDCCFLHRIHGDMKGLMN